MDLLKKTGPDFCHQGLHLLLVDDLPVAQSQVHRADDGGLTLAEDPIQCPIGFVLSSLETHEERVTEIGERRGDGLGVGRRDRLFERAKHVMGLIGGQRAESPSLDA